MAEGTLVLETRRTARKKWSRKSVGAGWWSSGTNWQIPGQSWNTARTAISIGGRSGNGRKRTNADRKDVTPMQPGRFEWSITMNNAWETWQRKAIQRYYSSDIFAVISRWLKFDDQTIIFSRWNLDNNEILKQSFYWVHKKELQRVLRHAYQWLEYKKLPSCQGTEKA
jgi:hypothetical protein